MFVRGGVRAVRWFGTVLLALSGQALNTAHDPYPGHVNKLSAAVLLNDLHEIIVSRNQRDGDKLWRPVCINFSPSTEQEMLQCAFAVHS